MPSKTTTTLYPLEWLSIKKEKTSVSEETEKLEPSYIASWVVKWYSYYGRMEWT